MAASRPGAGNASVSSGGDDSDPNGPDEMYRQIRRRAGRVFIQTHAVRQAVREFVEPFSNSGAYFRNEVKIKNDSVCFKFLRN